MTSIIHVIVSRECIFVKEREVSGTMIVVDVSCLGEEFAEIKGRLYIINILIIGYIRCTYFTWVGIPDSLLQEFISAFFQQPRFVALQGRYSRPRDRVGPEKYRTCLPLHLPGNYAPCRRAKAH